MRRKDFKYGLIILVLALSILSCSQTKFDSEKWKNWTETESTMTLRWDMRKDLIKKHKLVDLTTSEITALLGEPEKKSETEFRYYLGMARHGIDTGSLILTIENGKVIDYKIWHG